MQCITRWVGRCGVGITGFFNIHIWITRPASYKKSKLYFFGKNRVMFRSHLDTVVGVWGVPDQNNNKSWHKPDCRNVLSDFLLEVHSAIKRPFTPAAAAAAGLLTEPQTAAEIVSFLTVWPVCVFLKNNYFKHKIYIFLFNFWPQLFSHNSHGWFLYIN